MPPQIENRKQKSKAEKSKPLAPQTRGSRVSKETKSTAKSKGNPESLHYNEGKIFSLSDSESEEAANTNVKIGPGKVNYFWKPNEPSGFLGQWYTSVFKDEDGTKYTCAGQYMMYHKALILSAPDIAARIMATKNPSEMKHLGSVIKPYNEKLWAELAANAVANHSADSDDVYLPTLVLCPSTLIDTWYSEWLQYFSSQLTLRQWYGSKHSIRDLSRQKVLIGARNEALLQYLDELEPRNPHTARVVILTSFSMWQQRSLKKNKAAEESDPGKGEEDTGVEEEADLCDDYTSIFSGRFARIVCDEAHYIKNHQTRTAIWVKKLQCRVSWLITATPMINKMADLHGYLHLIWDPDWEIKTVQSIRAHGGIPGSV